MYVDFILLVSVKTCVTPYMFKTKKIPSGQNTHHYVGQHAHARGRFIPQFCQLEYCHKLAIIVAMDTWNSIYMYMIDMGMRLIFLHTLIETLASIHDVII